MKLTLQRLEYKPTGIFSHLDDEEGNGIAKTLEHAYDRSGSGTVWYPKIPPGVFVCRRGEHVLHSGPLETFEITGVPGHTGLLFHCGNLERDSEGCVLLGEEIVGDVLIESRRAFAKFMLGLTGIDEFELEVRA